MVKSSLCLVIAHALQRASKSSSSVKLQSHNEEDCLAWKSLSLSLSLLFFLEIHFIVASCTMLLFLILQVDARVLVFSAAGMATRCPATGVDKNNPAQLRHSYGTASSSREICDDIRNATTNPLAVHSTNKPLLGRKTQLYHHMQLPG